LGLEFLGYKERVESACGTLYLLVGRFDIESFFKAVISANLASKTHTTPFGFVRKE